MRVLAITALAAAMLAGAARAEPAWDAKAGGINTLPGVQYRVLKSGPASGETARRSDDVTVRYEGRFEDGKVFDSTEQHGEATTTFPLQRLIPGWTGTLQLMRPGDIWLIRVPPWLAYGAKGRDTIPPSATLIFKVELVSAAPHVDAPAAK